MEIRARSVLANPDASVLRDLTAAQAVEVQAVNDYQKSLANLEKVRGTVLERNRIEM